jgi:hypothetical protein
LNEHELAFLYMNDRYEAMRHWVWANHLSREGRKEGVPGCIADEIPACILI